MPDTTAPGAMHYLLRAIELAGRTLPGRRAPTRSWGP